MIYVAQAMLRAPVQSKIHLSVGVYRTGVSDRIMSTDLGKTWSRHRVFYVQGW